MKLRKADVEALLARYDGDAVDALTEALRIVLDQPDATWEQLLQIGFTDPRLADLSSRDPAALDRLAAELNELRTIASPPSST